MEAETGSLTEGLREALWLINLYKEVNWCLKPPIKLYEDNKGAITTAYNPTNHNRTKHTLLRYHFVREQLRKGNVSITYLNTNDMPADGLTKALSPPKFQLFLGLLGLEDRAL